MQCKRHARDYACRLRRVIASRYDLRAVAWPPLRPAAFFCAVVPPCDELLREELEPPRLDEPGEFEMRAARSFDIPLSLSASYCFSFLTLGRLLGMDCKYPWKSQSNLSKGQPRSPSPRTTANCAWAPSS